MNLFEEFKNIANKLKKSQRVVFKKQDTKEISNEFNKLSIKFDKCGNLSSDYAGLCFLGISKCCEENSGEAQAALMKGARMFRKSNDIKKKLGCISNNSNIEGAYRCYSQALFSEEKDSVMKACIIREFKEIKNNISITSNFSSNSHRIYELEVESNNDIRSNDYCPALEKLTEIVEDFSERKCEHLYLDVLFRVEITVLLLLLLILPVNRNSPSYVKIMEKFTWDNENFNSDNTNLSEEKSELVLLLEMLVMLVNSQNQKDCNSIKEVCDNISCHHLISPEQKILLEALLEKYEN